MRTRELEELQHKLLALKASILNAIAHSNSNISALNSLKSSELADIGSASSMAFVSENTLIKNKRDLRDIEAALQKIPQKLYGKCEMCGKQIDIKRLRVKPHARFCITCRGIYEKGGIYDNQRRNDDF